MNGKDAHDADDDVVLPRLKNRTRHAYSQQAADTIALSSLDKCMLPAPVMLLLAFDDGHAVHNPVETIRTALSRALLHYGPIAGHLDDHGGIVCTGDGVAFVAATASFALEEVDTATLQRMDLAVGCPAGGVTFRDTNPLLLVQVTEFTAGGFVVGVTWNHAVADAAGIAQFLRAVGELACGVSPPLSVVPVRRWDDDALPGPTSSTAAALKATVDAGPQGLARLDFTVPVSLIRRVKAESGGGMTTFEAVAAVLWLCRTRAEAMSSSSPAAAPAPLRFPCNARAHAGAGYYGNCAVVQVVPATSGAVASSGIGDLVRLIRRAERVPDLLSSSSSGDGGAAAPDAGGKAADAYEWYDMLAVVSWLNLGLEAADLGGGGATRVVWKQEWTRVPRCMLCPPGRGKDGVSVSSLCVKAEHVDDFPGELAKLAAST